ncbi:MAG: SDR family oxidoreductase [Thermoanaerobaculia bacterium]|nr:SDR family oxidoreductase [Thermoanaerobaculia bacterium]
MSESRTPAPDRSPNRYIEKVSLRTGKVLDEPIHPRQLLVHSHRDYHVVDVHARYMMSRVIKATGREEEALRKMKQMRRLGFRTSRAIARMFGQKDPEKISKALFGLKEKEYFFRYKKLPRTREEVNERLIELERQTRERYEAALVDGQPRLRVLLTGGTGFVGKEIIWQAAHDDAIREMVVLIRPKTVRDRKSGEVLEVLSPADRGAALLRQLWLEDHPGRGKFRFIAGDVEEPRLGIDDDEMSRLEQSITHVIHCAASVAFDDPYEDSFSANVSGSLNALSFSLELQEAEGSPFVAHVSIETSYIHGRQTKDVAREDEVVFPRNFYNNYYELTKAIASIEAERFMLEKGLRVTQLCPAIVIGEARTGNNRGDTKVVNAPINLFGRAAEARAKKPKNLFERSKVAMITQLACIFPGDPTAKINLIPVDRVAAGILASLTRPEAVGERVHLATDKRVTSQEMLSIVYEELGAKVKLAEPALHRTVTLPLLTKVLVRLKQQKMARILDKLGTIFGGYSEWGQPTHEVGKDVEILGLSPDRPDARVAFRMLCRHNRYVQEYGTVRDLDEISRREKRWRDLIDRLEAEHGKPAGEIPPDQFRAALAHTEFAPAAADDEGAAPERSPGASPTTAET